MPTRWTGLLAVAAAVASAALGPVPTSAAVDGVDPAALHLVTLDGPGTSGYRGPLTEVAAREMMLAEQADVLLRAGIDEVAYRWTTALNGFAAALTAEEAAAVAADPAVASVERNEVRPLAGAPATGGSGVPGRDTRGGRGAVLGVVDSGIWPESSLFADVPGLGRPPRGFRGECQPGEDWPAETCTGKLVGARWFVTGFGEDQLRATATLSARDDVGHGTQVASVAAGNAGVSVHVPGQGFPRYAGLAPQARVAAYKACWAAPDPEDDGCATADLVAAVDSATADGVDVLTLAVAGSTEPDTLDRALLGAAEGGVLVVAAAGNDGGSSYAGHPSPWVVTVGAATAPLPHGRVAPAGVTGAMTAGRPVGPAPLVTGREATADGSSPAAATRCEQGALDAARTDGAVVVCRRGGSARVEKSEAVRQADGVGMVLVNSRRGPVEADLHSVPTVHLDRAAGHRLLAWHRAHPRARVTLRPTGPGRGPARVASWSPSGDPAGALVKPDVVAPAAGLLGAVPPTVREVRWDFLAGTSAATAWTAGAALRLAAREGWSADRVRSALLTTASPAPVATPALRQGSGVVAAQPPTAGLAFLPEPGAHRAWLEGHGSRLNAPSALLSGGATTTRRTVTNLTGRTARFTARVVGFADHLVVVRPATLTLRPGESAGFRITAPDRVIGPLDDGWVVWEGPGTRDRVPVVLAR